VSIPPFTRYLLTNVHTPYSCTTFASITVAPAKRDRVEKKRMPVEAVMTPAPVV
jgi:hypothetical protein